jgi:pimeloyl-ACP methyl ester carboxylesterase
VVVENKRLKVCAQDRTLYVDYFLRPGHEETLLFLHGLGCTKADFQRAVDVDTLRTHTLVAYDFPGHGNSEYPSELSLDMDFLTEITADVIKTLNLSPVVLIGHSMGGLVSLLYAERYASSVKAFINVEGNLAKEDCFFSRKIAELDFETFRKEFFWDYIGELKKSSNTGFRKYAETLEAFRPIRALYDCCPSLVAYSDSGKLIEEFLALDVSELFIHGSENRELSYIPELKQRGCKVVEISKSNHAPHYDNPDEFYSAMARFLRDV